MDVQILTLWIGLRPFFILRIVRPRIFESELWDHCAKQLDHFVDHDNTHHHNNTNANDHTTNDNDHNNMNNNNYNTNTNSDKDNESQHTITCAQMTTCRDAARQGQDATVYANSKLTCIVAACRQSWAESPARRRPSQEGTRSVRFVFVSVPDFSKITRFGSVQTFRIRFGLDFSIRRDSACVFRTRRGSVRFGSVRFRARFRPVPELHGSARFGFLILPETTTIILVYYTTCTFYFEFVLNLPETITACSFPRPVQCLFSA